MLTVISAVVALGACSNSAAPPLDHSAGLRCVDDSPRCVRTRIATVKALSNSGDRRWVMQPASPKAYASGVRLFALRNQKSVLSCKELSQAKRETAGARKTLRRPGAGLTPAQISRATMLAKEVGRDLGREFKRRCRR